MLLCAGASVDMVDNTGCTALMWAVMHGRSQVTEVRSMKFFFHYHTINRIATMLYIGEFPIYFTSYGKPAVVFMFRCCCLMVPMLI